MDRPLLERLVARTAFRIGELERQIERQRSIVAEFEASNHGNGESGDIARDLLQTLELNLRRQVSHQKWISAQRVAGGSPQVDQLIQQLDCRACFDDASSR